MTQRIVLGLSLFLTVATSTADTCDTKYNIPNDCYCDQSVMNLPIPSPEGFVLYAMCHPTDIVSGTEVPLEAARTLTPERFDMGAYFYRGSKTFSGKVIKADEGTSVSYRVDFYPDRPLAEVKAKRKHSRLQEFSHLKSISLVGDESTIGTEKLKASEKVSWCARATITFKKIVISVADTEGEGPQAIQYRVISRDKFRKC